jgi:hypothetical protein
MELQSSTATQRTGRSNQTAPPELVHVVMVVVFHFRSVHSRLALQCGSLNKQTHDDRVGEP